MAERKEQNGDLTETQSLDFVRQIVAEACLSVLDLAGARNALEGTEGPARKVLVGWIDAIDPPSGLERTLPSRVEEEASPRAAAEIAIHYLRAHLHRAGPSIDHAREIVERCTDRLVDCRGKST